MKPLAQLRLTIPQSENLRYEAIRLLVNGLGLTKAACFLRETGSSQADYLDLKEQLFGDKTATELYANIKNRSQQPD